MSARKTSKSAALYCRISDDRHADEAGVRRQRADVIEHAERKGYHVVGVFIDNDISASKNLERPEHDKIMALVEAGEVEVIVPWVLDRLYRDVRELESLIDFVEAHPVRIDAAGGGDYDLNTVEGRGFARIVVAMAMMETERKAQRTTRKHRELAELGRSPGGPRPFGWADDRVHLHPVESELLREAVRRVLTGESVMAIACDWNTRGIATPQKSARWRPQALARMLTRPRIVGKRALRGTIITSGEWEPIVDERTYQRLVARLTPKPNPTHCVARKYLLPGFVFCAECGTPLRTKPNKTDGRRYQCRRDDGGCGALSINAEALELYVRDSVIDRLDVKRVTRAASSKSERTEERALDRLQAARAHADELLTMLGEGELTRGEYVVAKRSAEAELESAQREYAKTAHTAAAGLVLSTTKDLRTEWDGKSLDQKRALVGAALERIDVHRATVGANRVNCAPLAEGGRCDITWRASR